MKRALIVDDERNIRMLMEDALSDTHICSVVCDGREAMRLAGEAGLYDIVVMDLSMPHWDGLSALAMIDTLNPDCTAIVASGYITDADREQLASFRCVRAVVEKPFTLESFLSVVHEVEGAL